MRLRNITQISCINITLSPLSLSPPSNGFTFDNEGGLSNVAGCPVPPASM